MLAGDPYHRRKHQNICTFNVVITKMLSYDETLFYFSVLTRLFLAD